MMSHDGNHAAGPRACQVNGVQALGVRGAMPLEPAKNICDHFSRIRHEQFLHAVQLERSRHFAFMTVGIDGDDSNASIGKLFTLKPVHCDKPLTFSLCATVGHHEVLTDICDCDGWKRGFSDFNFHSDFTLSGWGTDKVKLAGGCVNRASRHGRSAPRKGIAA